METLAWCMMHGTYDEANQCLSPALLAGELSDPRRREQFPEKQKHVLGLLKSFQIVAKKVLSDDKVELKKRVEADPIPGQRPGSPFGIETMVKIGDEWKLGGGSRVCGLTWEEEGEIQKFVP